MNTTRIPARTALVAVLGLTVAGLAPFAVTGPASAARTTRQGTVPRLPIAAAVAVGRLTPDGCTRSDATGGADVTCSLHAMEGTTDLLGTTVPIWGFSSSGAAGTATAPGPVLVVREGDRVTLDLTNHLGEDVSLSLPGQPASSFTAGLHDRVATPGNAASYSFTAGRPGTFLYQAGHTADGARQVAMGLAGALVVLAADGQVAGHDYTDESVVVLSEIDPRLNADPQHFDLREFTPGWRLINGRPFPSTQPIATDQGHTVLLRYVNAGLRTHPMSLLGDDQLEVARNAHAATTAQSEVIAEVDPGATVDTLVTMPSGPDSQVTLFEEGQHLDNLGRSDADPKQIAAGGMMTYLDTAAPAPIDDQVGPKASHVTAGPSPSNGLAPVTVNADLSDVASGNSALTDAEVAVDDPTIGVGTGLAMIASPAFGEPTAHVSVDIPVAPTGLTPCDPGAPQAPLALSCLSAGKHIIYVRGRDAAGNWGAVGSVVLHLPKTGPSTTNGSVTPDPASGLKPVQVSATGDDGEAGNITGGELFVDTVGANGEGLALTPNRPAPVVSLDGAIPVDPAAGKQCSDPGVIALSCLAEGTHHVFVHSQDSLDLWGPVLDIPFELDKTGPTVGSSTLSPAQTNGRQSSPGNDGYLRVSARIDDLSASLAVQSNVVGGEGFLNPTSSNPAVGSGFGLVPDDGTFNSPSEGAYGLIPLSQVRNLPDGSYTVSVRGKDASGRWGELFAAPLVIDRTAPVLGALSATPTPTDGAATLTLTAPVMKDTAFQDAEFWIGDNDPGAGNATSATFAFVNGSVVVTIPLVGITTGPTTFHLRVQDLAGNWSNVAQTPVSVTLPNLILASPFTDLTTGWTTAVNSGAGAMRIAAAAAIPADPGNATGLAVSGTGRHFLVDATPIAEPAYHASFGFAPHSFAGGTNRIVRIFDGRTASGSAFGVDFRRLHHVDQVRITMARSGGTTASAWKTVSTGARVMRIDWVASGKGSLRLSVAGRPFLSRSGNNAAIRLDSVRLGLISGLGKDSKGTAYFDTFQSARETLEN